MINRTEIEQARDCIAAGGVVAIPTDTLYGLAADATNPDALEKVYEIKGRPSGMALPVLVSGWEQVGMVSTVAGRCGELARVLAERFWPGPLTLVLPASPELPPRLTAGLDTIAVRMPDHAIPLALAARLGRPITGTSANRSGEPDLTDPEELNRCLGGLVDGIIVSGEPPQGTASTIVAVSDDDLTLLRAGALPFPEVRRAAGLA
ncbi:MAG: L-threonylcarbamoyladenylate synthase [Chloroflexota bacterium]|nr:L-threonylcarbamoyladenylate synthase [Chloroflexota bacterium]MDE2685809.1 L-threonylcarbamoyladenylate synthase [Chloroflexota bacterium]